MQLLRPSTPCSALALPYYAARVPAGFPSPAQDYVERTLDLMNTAFAIQQQLTLCAFKGIP